MRRAAATVSLLVVVAASAAGCGEDEPDPQEGPSDPAVDSIAAGIVTANDPGREDPSLVTEDEATCIGEALVDNPGVDRLTEVGVLTDSGTYAGSPENVEEGVASAWAAAHAICLDLHSYVVDTVRLIADAVVDEPAGDAAWQEALACVRRDVPVDDLRALVAARASGSQPESTPGDPFNACIGATAGPPGG